MQFFSSRYVQYNSCDVEEKGLFLLALVFRNLLPHAPSSAHLPHPRPHSATPTSRSHSRSRSRARFRLPFALLGALSYHLPIFRLALPSFVFRSVPLLFMVNPSQPQVPSMSVVFRKSIRYQLST